MPAASRQCCCDAGGDERNGEKGAVGLWTDELHLHISQRDNDDGVVDDCAARLTEGPVGAADVETVAVLRQRQQPRTTDRKHSVCRQAGLGTARDSANVWHRNATDGNTSLVPNTRIVGNLSGASGCFRLGV